MILFVGPRQIDVVGLKDKREITGLFGISMAGRMLPPQLIYPGKTFRSHPQGTSRWLVIHTCTVSHMLCMYVIAVSRYIVLVNFQCRVGELIISNFNTKVLS